MLVICTLYYLGETYPEAATLPVDLVLCIVIIPYCMFSGTKQDQNISYAIRKVQPALYAVELVALLVS